MKQQPKLVLTFYTSAGAMELERLCKAAGVPGRLAPVPRSITSDCGIGWTMPLADKPKLLAALNGRDHEIAGMHEINGMEHKTWKTK